jgi:FlaA1/EpsC-like NDP-sugar epimerase
LIAGAGDIGAMAAREIRRGQNGRGFAVGFVDDDPRKQGRRIENLEVMGTTFDIPRLIKEYKIDEILVAAPSAPSRLLRQIYEHGMKAGIRVSTVPSLADFIEGKGALRQVRDVSIEDLLGRDPVQIDQGKIESFLSRKRILVTGAGGSIGSELCRQIARFHPSRLIALDHDENRLAYLGVELTQHDPTLDLLLVVGDIRDWAGIRDLTEDQRPQVIFHAAAHKHVPLLEGRPREAIRNNVQGTLNVARAAQACRAEAMVLISTDKAVDPTNVMGASKRVCELIVQALGQTQGPEGTPIFSAVRFGNVMGSEGSVIPIFRRQLAQGGPLTVTHPDARRYFMTVAEASQLVLQAASLGKSGDVFILDMGEQVRILDVARQLIRLSGLEPEKDIPIVFIGLRPGEKLEEDILTDRERVRTTRHAKVFRCNLDPVPAEEILSKVGHIVDAADSASPAELKNHLRNMVPEFRSEISPPPLPESVPSLEEEAGEVPAEVQEVADLGVGAHTKGPSLTDRVLAGAVLLTIGIPVALLFGIRRLLGPRDVVLVREVRVGQDRRVKERRKTSGWAPIDRRFKDRRRRNMGGMPYTAYRFRFQGVPHAAWLRKVDDALRALGAEAIPGFLNVLRGNANLTDLYPGRPSRSAPGIRSSEPTSPASERTVFPSDDVHGEAVSGRAAPPGRN